jgi:SAM-dependent methyltransferase
MSEGATFHPQAPGDLTQLRDVLAEAGLNEASFARTAGLDQPGQPLDLPRVLRNTSAPSRFNTLMRLLTLGRPVPAEDARRALAPVPIEVLCEVGLLTMEEGSVSRSPTSGLSSRGNVRAQAALLPLGDLWTIRDLDPEFSGRPMGSEHVLGVGVATLMLANLSVRRSGERVLDLGTGGGAQAFLAARHARQVVGTDTNPRALAMAEIGGRLNGMTNLEFRLGSLYDPVAEDRFDLIVANPPFAVSPESKFIYRDGGMPGDALCEHVIRHAGEHLAEGGFATVICDWHHAGQDDWQARPAAWAKETGCDAWLLKFYTLDPVTYASQWIHARERGNPEEYGQRLDEWLAYYARLGIGALSRGAIILHRRAAARHWFAASEVQFDHGAGCGAQIQRIFAARDLLSGLAHPSQLLDATLRLAPGHQLRHTLVAEGGNWIVREALLRHESGFDFEGRVDRVVGALLAGCDGTRTLRTVTESLAADLGAPLASVQSSAVELVAVLMDKAFFEIVAGPSS